MMAFNEMIVLKQVILIVLIFAVGTMAMTLAQIDYDRYTPYLDIDPSPFWWGEPTSGKTMNAIDMDADGDLDLVVAGDYTGHRIYYNYGGGLSTIPGWQLSISYTEDVMHMLTADLAGDGFPEFLTIQIDGEYTIPSCRLYSNLNGFPLKTNIWSSQEKTAVGGDTGDIDGDGTPDLILACENEPDAAYRGLSSGTFEMYPFWTAGASDHSSHAALVDIDQDGDPDLVVASAQESPLRIYFNTEGVLEQNPSWFSDDDYAVSGIVHADIDGDGYPEVLLTCYNHAPLLFHNAQVQLETSPFMTFTPDDDIARWEYHAAAGFGDLNNDGYLELVLGYQWMNETCFGGDYIHVYFNNGGELQNEEIWRTDSERYAMDIKFADFDGDGDLELALLDSHRPELYQNNLTDWGGFGVTLKMPDTDFTAGDPCYLYALIANPGASVENVPVFIILDVYGEFFCAPGWRPVTQAVDCFMLDLYPGLSRLEVIPKFTWPAIEGFAVDLRFYGVITNSDMTVILGHQGIWRFGYH